MFVVGIDLSGPSNTKDTAFACFEDTCGELHLAASPLQGATDLDILNIIHEFAARKKVVVGLDAPLSYNPGGGLRPADRALKSKLIEKGMHPGSVMPPTLMRMAYLTLRGLAVARLIASVGPDAPGIVEVHPGAVMALRGAPLEWVRSFKRDKDARRGLLAWLKSQNLHGFPNFGKQEGPEDHMIAAYAAALGAWDWAKNKPRWLAPAQPPIHPYDFAC